MSFIQSAINTGDGRARSLSSAFHSLPSARSQRSGRGEGGLDARLTVGQVVDAVTVHVGSSQVSRWLALIAVDAESGLARTMNVVSQDTTGRLDGDGLLAVVDGLGLALDVLNALVVNIIDFVDFVCAVGVVVVLVGDHSQRVHVVSVDDYVDRLVVLGIVVLVDDHGLEVVVLGLDDLLLGWQLALLLLVVIGRNWRRGVARVVDWRQLWQLVLAVVGASGHADDDVAWAW